MIGSLRRFRLAMTVLALLGVALTAAPSSADQDPAIRRLADIFAGTSVQDGTAIGVGVGIVIGKRAYFFSYGDAVAAAGDAPAVPFTPDTVFQIGSTTKIFTTNLLGQAVHEHALRLSDPLTSLSGETGLLPGMQSVTLLELGDFTAGLPNYAPSCLSVNSPPGCLPNTRPSMQLYDADDFLAYFQNFSAPAALPAAYDYSDFSTGLLGLLLGGTSALDNHAVEAWFASVKRQILDPLGMRSTYLYVPAEARGRTASGYQLAVALPVVSNGNIGGYTLVSHGALYTAMPKVQVTGGGRGAAATADLADGRVAELRVVTPGESYDPPSVTFGPATKPATARLVVSNGRVVGVKILEPGAGYDQAPTVTFSAPAQGRPARGIARIALGGIVFVTITDGGSGYQPPVSVRIGAPNAAADTIPIWAPAGALSSTIRDMTVLARAALGHRFIGGRPVDPAVLDGFRIAETPYACQAPDPSLQNCGATTGRSALAWGVMPADLGNGVPAIVVKDGGVGGFSSEVRLMPARDMAVVVFANAREVTADGPTLTAERIADNLLYALYYARKPDR